MPTVTEPTIRPATRCDLAAIVAMLADDELGAMRESPGDISSYEAAFAAISASPDILLMVVEDAGEIVGTAQVAFIPGLSHRGATRADIEAVRIARSRRGAGLGGTLIASCIDAAEARGCRMVQLTSNAQREEAHRFYRRLGFTQSHVGFKLALPRV